MNVTELYKHAQAHVEAHQCSAHPYKYGEHLFELVRDAKPQRILEIGTGAGFTTMILALAAPTARIISLEKNIDHAKLAHEYFKEQGIASRVELLAVVAEEWLPQQAEQFDLIFFDGFQIHYEFLPHYERLLQTGGLLVTANTHLTSRTSDQFFEELRADKKWRILEEFGDTIVAKRQ